MKTEELFLLARSIQKAIRPEEAEPMQTIEQLARQIVNSQVNADEVVELIRAWMYKKKHLHKQIKEYIADASGRGTEEYFDEATDKIMPLFVEEQQR